MERISFVGLGVVGLITQVCFASRGYNTIGMDTDEQKLRTLRSGNLPFHEPQLRELLDETETNIKFSADIDYAIENSRLTFVTVGTPSKPDGCIDLSQIIHACRSIGRALRNKSEYHVVVVKSTIVPGTTDSVIKRILKEESNKNIGEDFGLTVNPEFLREGTGVNDTFHPHLLVIGSADQRSQEELERLWLEFYNKDAPMILKTNFVNAELIKYANNAFLATKVGFINSMANICQKFDGADVEKVAKAIGMDPRISPLFLKAGPGYGGSCLPKDVKALINLSQAIGFYPTLLMAVDQVNERQSMQVVDLAKSALGDLKEKIIAILGVAFKKDTDDIREAASIKIIRHLVQHGAKVRANDPMALENLKKIFGDEIIYAKNKFECLTNADCCIILTEWDEYKSMKPDDFAKYMKTPCIIDARRIYNADDFVHSTKYFAIGLKPVKDQLTTTCKVNNQRKRLVAKSKRAIDMPKPVTGETK